MSKIAKKLIFFREKSGRIAAIGAVGIVMIIIIAVMLNEKQPNIELKKEIFIVEYGTPLSTNPSDYVIAEKEVLKETNIDIKNVDAKHEDDNFHLKTGTYKAVVIYKDERLEFIIKVEDTVAPEFTNFKETIEVDREYDGDLTEQFSAEDLATVTISTNAKEVDFSKAGEYKAKVTAEDAYKNATTKEFTIVVGEKSKAEKEAEAKHQEEDAKAQEEVQQNQSSSETNATTTTTPTQPQVTDTSSVQGGSGTTPTPVPSVCAPTWKNLGNSGEGFYSYDEADAWADEITWDRKSQWYGMGWWVIQRNDTCGGIGWTIEFY